VAVLTPAHQFPTGVVSAPDRRARLLEWVEERDALLVEDDYDSELRYDRVPVGALQGLAPERVCHIGSLSKRLAPGLRIGWILSPSWLTGDLTYEKGVCDGAAPAVEQLALADFLGRGELDRHLRRMRLLYRRRREVLLRGLAGARPCGVAAGSADVHRVVREASARGVALEALSSDALDTTAAPGLVLGFANLSESALARAAQRVSEAIRTSMP
jgi:GntR family transcriptional regulator/MocR family aminotransferase